VALLGYSKARAVRHRACWGVGVWRCGGVTGGGVGERGSEGVRGGYQRPDGSLPYDARSPEASVSMSLQYDSRVSMLNSSH